MYTVHLESKVAWQLKYATCGLSEAFSVAFPTINADTERPVDYPRHPLHTQPSLLDCSKGIQTLPEAQNTESNWAATAYAMENYRL